MHSRWKKKERDGRLFMICQNSEPEFSKYPQWGPVSGTCEEWSEVANDTTATLCHKCTSRSVSI